MIDFKLTETGDIDLAQAYQYPSFTINLYIPKAGEKGRRFPGFRIDMDTDIYRYDVSEHDFRIDFATVLSKKSGGIIAAPPVYTNEELAQEITIRLKTELGEFPYIEWLGSRLVLERHEDIRSETVREHVRQYVEEAIADVIFPEEPAVSVEWVDDPGRFRYETLRIVVDTRRTKAYEAVI